MTRPAHDLPDHGTEARYQGAVGRPACRCRRCIDGWTRAGKKRQLARLQGRPATIPAEAVTAHLTRLYASSMTTGQIARAAGVSVNTVVDHGRGRFPAIRRSTADKLLAVQPGQHGSIGRVPAVATRRRLQALYAIGHGSYLLATAAGLSGNGVANIAEGRVSDVTIPTRDTVADVYRDLAGQPGPSQRARNIAARHGWAPPAAWDDDTIDDPDAIPQWTGHCGTDHGWWQHRVNNIPVCQPCHRAHEAWKAERKHLPHGQRVSQLRLAQAAASTRGADLADEARRLFAYGYDLEQAADRLGVKKNTLSQELRRHPVRDDLEVAA